MKFNMRAATIEILCYEYTFIDTGDESAVAEDLIESVVNVVTSTPITGDGDSYPPHLPQ